MVDNQNLILPEERFSLEQVHHWRDEHSFAAQRPWCGRLRALLDSGKKHYLQGVRSALGTKMRITPFWAASKDTPTIEISSGKQK